jgi:hypothetical protein
MFRKAVAVVVYVVLRGALAVFARFDDKDLQRDDDER